MDVRFGIENGFFSEEGLDVSVRVVFGGPEIAAAYDSGDLKIGELGTPPGITAIARGHRFKIIGSGLCRGVGLFFLVNSSLKDWEDLKGKTLGSLSIGSCSYWYLREMLSQHGINPDRDVDIRGLGPDYPRQLELFERGDISALLSPEPNGAIGEARGLVNVWGNVLSLADVPRLQWSIQVANEDFLCTQPGVVRRFLKVTQKAARYLHDHIDEAIASNERLFKLPHELAVRSAMRERPTLHFDGKLDPAGLQQAIELQSRLGAISEVKPITAFVAEGFQPQPRH